ncbi:NAD(P)/FAD-dependent oxidoreductase [soil metagenome]
MPEEGSHFEVIVVGAGAAGLMCALTAGQRGRRVALLEHNDRVGKKIGISGGGRCNFTNIHAGPENYLSAHPDFCRSALARYSPWDFIAMVERHGIKYHEKKLGQQFCDGSSREIIEMLLAECEDGKVEVRCDTRVLEVEKTDQFRLTTTRGELTCQSLVVATGSLSFAKLGATDYGHRLARQFGIKVTPMRPGLVPLTLSAADLSEFRELSGLALPVVAKCGRKSFEEAMLFTHRGVSGPAILQISSFWKEGDLLEFDLLPDKKDEGWLERERGAKTSLASLLGNYWPNRFAEAWAARHAPDKPLAHFRHRELADLEQLLHRWPMRCVGTEGYPKAEVTLGGVDTGELSSKTMEARKVAGLYFIGEVVDVTGWLGGYNFQWAWASAAAAGGVA